MVVVVAEISSAKIDSMGLTFSMKGSHEDEGHSPFFSFL